MWGAVSLVQTVLIRAMDLVATWLLVRGFWAGLWWRRALISGQEQDKEQALNWSQKLQVWLEEPSINRSFVFWYGSGLGSIGMGIERPKPMSIRLHKLC